MSPGRGRSAEDSVCGGAISRKGPGRKNAHYLCDIYVFALPTLQLLLLISGSADRVMDIS